MTGEPFSRALKTLKVDRMSDGWAAGPSTVLRIMKLCANFDAFPAQYNRWSPSAGR